MSVQGIGAYGPAGIRVKDPAFDTQRVGEATQRSNADFAEALAKAESTFVTPERLAVGVIDGVAQGAEGRIHESLMAVDRADISLRLLVTVRNKIVDAYREVMQMGS